MKSKLLIGVLAVAGASVLAPSANAAFTTATCNGGALAAGGASFQNALHNSVWQGAGNVLSNYCSPTAPFPVTYPTNGATDGPVGPISITGSGNGRKAFGSAGAQPGKTARDKIIRLVGSDEAPDQGEINNMEAGEATTADDAKLHTIPSVLGAVTVMVNWPDACQTAAVGNQALDFTKMGTVAGAGGGLIGNPGDHTQRFRLPRPEMENVFAGTYRTWKDIPSLGLGNNACGNTPLKRVVRNDDSGSTFILKQYLNALNPARGWSTTYINSDSSARSTLWPGVAGNTVPTNAGARNAATAPRSGTDPLLISNGLDGGGALRNQLAVTDGAFGYAVIGDARGGNRESGGVPPGMTGTPSDTDPTWNRQDNPTGNIGQFDIVPAKNPRFNVDGSPAAPPPADGSAIPYPDDDRFWIPLPNPNGAWTEPTLDPNGFKNPTAVPTITRGAGCTGTVFQNIPAPTAGNTDPTLSNAGWFQTVGVDSPAGYVVCGISYLLAWDDYAKAYAGSTDPNEEQHAKSAKDYLTAIVTRGQNQLPGDTSPFSQDYAPLAGQLLTIAQNGVAGIDYNKSNSGGGGGGGGTIDPGTGTGTGTPPAGGGTPPPAGTGGVSNAFSIVGSRSKNGVISIDVQGPGAGVFGAIGKATVPRTRRASAAKTITVGSTRLSVAKAGKYTLTIKLNSAAKKALRKTGKLKVSVAVKYTPTGGTAASKTKTVTVRGKKRT